MPTSIETIPDAPIIIVQGIPAVESIRKETEDAIALIASVLDRQTGPVFLIMDLRAISMDLDDVIYSSICSARGSSTLLHHANIRENVFILSDGIIKMAAKGLNNATFGMLKPRMFDTLEEALDYCHAQVGVVF